MRRSAVDHATAYGISEGLRAALAIVKGIESRQEAIASIQALIKVNDKTVKIAAGHIQGEKDGG